MRSRVEGKDDDTENKSGMERRGRSLCYPVAGVSVDEPQGIQNSALPI
jgi:hypothetical protein